MRSIFSAPSLRVQTACTQLARLPFTVTKGPHTSRNKHPHTPSLTSLNSLFFPLPYGKGSDHQDHQPPMSPTGSLIHARTQARMFTSSRIDRPYYFDYQATTPVDPRVLDEMLPYLIGSFENPHSNSHAGGWEVADAVEKARVEVAALLGLPASRAREIVFTSGATESNNLAIKGLANFYETLAANSVSGSGVGSGRPKRHIITTQIEHKCVLQCCRMLQLLYQQTNGARGYDVTFLPVTSEGLVDIQTLENAIREDTLLVSVIHVNNEIGVVQDLKQIGQLCRKRGVVFHTDSAQGFGKVPVNVDEMCIDMLSISGHKIYGPKGIGALFLRAKKPRIRLQPIIDGGGQERGLRSGTLAPALVVGLGAASRICSEEMENDQIHVQTLAQILLTKLSAELPDIELNGSLIQRYFGNLNISFKFVEGESLIMSIGEMAVSSGSACTSASLEPSYVLRALGVGEETAHTSIRFGIGRFTRESEVHHLVRRLVSEVRRLRELSPLYEIHLNEKSGGEKPAAMVWT